MGIFSQHDIGDNAGLRAHFRCLPPIYLDIVFDSYKIRTLAFPHFYHLLKSHLELIRAIVGRNQGFLCRPNGCLQEMFEVSESLLLPFSLISPFLPGQPQCEQCHAAAACGCGGEFDV